MALAYLRCRCHHHMGTDKTPALGAEEVAAGSLAGGPMSCRGSGAPGEAQGQQRHAWVGNEGGGAARGHWSGGSTGRSVSEAPGCGREVEWAARLVVCGIADKSGKDGVPTAACRVKSRMGGG